MTQVVQNTPDTKQADLILLDILNKTDGFSEPPIILKKIIELSNNPTSSASRVADVICGSPSIATRVLRVANSAHYGFPRRINSVPAAVALLGVHSIRSLVLVATAYNLFYKPGPLSKYYQGLCEHSIATAVLSKIIAGRNGNSDIESAYISGLLHDIGKLVLIERFQDQYLQILKLKDLDSSKFLQNEEAMFGFSHTLVAAVLLEKWNLPENIVEAVAAHHHIVSSDSFSGIVGLANILVTILGFNILSPSEEEKSMFHEFELTEDKDYFRKLIGDQLRLFKTTLI